MSGDFAFAVVVACYFGYEAYRLYCIKEIGRIAIQEETMRKAAIRDETGIAPEAKE